MTQMKFSSLKTRQSYKEREKGRDLTQSMIKAPTPAEKSETQHDTTKNRHQFSSQGIYQESNHGSWLKLDLYDKNVTYKYAKDKNLVWNQYTLFDSLRFIHSECGSSPVQTCANKRTLLEEK